ncbi:carbohydrate esterase family 4 protein [Flagelloscypha sp. PMI_526]|nr:carbohydrate esterase family 4 protein [Flagelloscypha sp. PMI_526]
MTFIHALLFFLSTLVLATHAGLITQCTEPNTVAITLDDGPYIYQKGFVDLAEQWGARFTFFVNGMNYGCIYDKENVESIRYAMQKGHQIASHTWAHPDLATLSYDQVNEEFRRIDDALLRIHGIMPAFMRPPYGSYNDAVLDVGSRRGQSIVTWDFDSGDSTGSTQAESIKAYDNTLRNHPSTLLALNHETYPGTLKKVLPHALKTLKTMGYRMVTVAECLGSAPYQQVVSPKARDDSWQC